jgi:TRAP-type mannitol/chloroaromatic compound transport system permease small subunit
MQKLLLSIDKLSTLLGHTFSWLIVVLTLLISWEVFSRYVLGTPHAWAFDVQIMLYGTLFMMAGAYTLAKNGHVRGDVLYGFFEPRTQATVDLILYLVFFIPGVVALSYAGYNFAADSFRINEHSSISADGPPIYPFKAVIPIAGTMLLLQGLVEIARCIICLRDGEWPSRVEDVEEVDVDKLKEMVRIDDPEVGNDQATVGYEGGGLVHLPERRGEVKR